MKYVGYISLGIFIFIVGIFIGDSLGRSGLQSEQASGIAQQNEYTADLRQVGTLYKSAIQLCEQKYQLGINGDMNSAFQVKGQLDIILNQAQQIENKYPISTQ